MVGPLTMKLGALMYKKDVNDEVWGDSFKATNVTF